MAAMASASGTRTSWSRWTRSAPTRPWPSKRIDGAEDYIRWFEPPSTAAADARAGLGYVAPPLDGVWATAPYLHNGSVPTLAALLDTRNRPTYWRHEAPSPTTTRRARLAL
jgi:hypothetical protein